MDSQLERRTLKADFQAFTQILVDRGLTAVEVTEDELEKMHINDLRKLVRDLRDVARTPSS